MKHISVVISELIDSEKMKTVDSSLVLRIYEAQSILYQVLLSFGSNEKDAFYTCEYFGKVLENKKKDSNAILSLNEIYKLIQEFIINLVNDNNLAEDIANAFVEVYRSLNLGKIVGYYLSKKYLFNRGKRK